MQKTHTNPYSSISKNSFELWSTDYLNFEPKQTSDNDLRSMRLAILRKLNEGLKNLKYHENGLLECVYSALTKPADIDNILFYNPGMNLSWEIFQNLCLNGIRFEYRNSNPPLFDSEFQTYYQYHLVREDEQNTRSWPVAWQVDELLSEWDVPCRFTKDPPDAFDFWYALKSNPGKVNIKSEHTYLNDVRKTPYFGLNVRLSAPRTMNINLAKWLKPIIDGIVSAFHGYDTLKSDINTRVAQVIRRLKNNKTITQMLNSNEDIAGVLKRYLLDESKSVLRRVELINGNGWNPDDKSCVTGEAICDYNNQFRLSGRLFTVKRNITVNT